ncbi:MAG: hypothetical protein V1836_02430 [Candidatus Aenigmatarchaeota archaeon]
MMFCEMCGVEINPGEDVVSNGRIVCRACAEVVGSKPETPDSEETDEEE